MMNSSPPIEASERKGNLHLRPAGAFSAEVVTELARLIAGHYNGRGNIFIHTDRVTAVAANSAERFGALLQAPEFPGERIYLTGERGRQICPEGGRLIIPRRPTNGQGGCSGCRRETTVTADISSYSPVGCPSSSRPPEPGKGW
jgi:hypothetical protein